MLRPAGSRAEVLPARVVSPGSNLAHNPLDSGLRLKEE